jgi:CoA:oxalate CoA-transferase
MTPMDELARLIECPELSVLAADRSSWYRNRDPLKRALQQHLVAKTTAHWLTRLEAADTWCANVLTWPQLVAHEGFTALDMTQTIRGSGGDTMRTTRCPIRIDGQVLKSSRAAPRLGAHTNEVARELMLPSTTMQKANA